MHANAKKTCQVSTHHLCTPADLTSKIFQHAAYVRFYTIPILVLDNFLFTATDIHEPRTLGLGFSLAMDAFSPTEQCCYGLHSQRVLRLALPATPACQDYQPTRPPLSRVDMGI